MQSSSFRLVAATAVAMVVAVVAGCGSNTTGGPGAGNAPPLKIQIKNGMPVGGVQKINAKQGQRIRFSVTSDVADEVHVHGYNYMKDVPKGGTISFEFPAKLEGAFEAELEHRKQQILSLKVYPS